MCLKYAETEVVKWGRQVAKNAGFASSDFLNDCQEEVDLPNNRKGSKTDINWVVSQIEEQKNDFNEVKIQYTPRSPIANGHTLAKLALGGNASVVWLDRVPGTS